MNIWFTKEKNVFVYNKDGYFFIGITKKLLKTLGTPISRNLPPVGEYFAKGEIFGSIESEDKALELFMPISATIEALNQNFTPLTEYPWLIRVTANFFQEDKIDLISYDNSMGDY